MSIVKYQTFQQRGHEPIEINLVTLHGREQIELVQGDKLEGLTISVDALHELASRLLETADYLRPQITRSPPGGPIEHIITAVRRD
jgi:hypothetical protein